MHIAYARVSTQVQDLDQQRFTLTAAGCSRIFEEKASGARRDRPELQRMLDHLRPGDVVNVTRLDRLARSTIDLLHIVDRIKENGRVFAPSRSHGPTQPVPPEQ
jgi:DNA invertase Pin-like site-specific DNA recombinase